MDTLSPVERSQRMSRVRSKNTKPEMVVRRLIHSLGYRYRLHRATLPGTPDLVFAGRKKLIFVHGCFWHRHEGCPKTRMPKSRLDFWGPKLLRNRYRDIETRRKLNEEGWDCLVIWECQTERNLSQLAGKINGFLNDDPIS